MESHKFTHTNLQVIDFKSCAPPVLIRTSFYSNLVVLRYSVLRILLIFPVLHTGQVEAHPPVRRAGRPVCRHRPVQSQSRRQENICDSLVILDVELVGLGGGGAGQQEGGEQGGETGQHGAVVPRAAVLAASAAAPAGQTFILKCSQRSSSGRGSLNSAAANLTIGELPLQCTFCTGKEFM